MHDTEYEAQKTRILAAVQKWRKPLGLEAWTLHHCFYRGTIPDTDNPDVLGQTVVQWEYWQARIDWNLQVVLGEDDDDLERAVCHELLHVLVNEMRPDRQTADQARHEERVVSSLAAACLWIWQAAREAPHAPV